MAAAYLHDTQSERVIILYYDIKENLLKLTIILKQETIYSRVQEVDYSNLTIFA